MEDELTLAAADGVAPALLDDFIRRAGRAGMQFVKLECFEHNPRALRLYRSRGFEPLHALHGCAWDGAGERAERPPHLSL